MHYLQGIEKGVRMPSWFGGHGLRLAVLVLLAPRSVPAQDVQGRVVDVVFGRPISGVVVTAVDPKGIVQQQGLTDAAGAFRLRAIGATTVLRTRRIGFLPRDTTLTLGEALAGPMVIRMSPLPTLLAPARVVEDNHCPERTDAGLAFGLLEQARAALLASTVARTVSPARMRRLVFERELAGDDRRVVSQTVRIDSATGTMEAFQAAESVATLLETGFVRADGRSDLYFAPDAQVLLSTEFSDTYCFSLSGPNTTKRDWIGVRFFNPSPRRGRVDIDGAVWVDTARRTLEQVAFRYVGVDARLMQFAPGGEITFREASNGVVFINSWVLRLVAPQVDTLSGSRNTRPTLRVTYQRADVGGIVASATWPGAVEWRAPQGRLTAELRLSSGSPAAHTQVRLEGTPYAGVSDQQGLVTIDGLLPGPYALVVADSELDAIAVTIPTSGRFVAAPDSTTRVAIEIPTAETFARSQCSASTRFDSGPVLLGRVQSASGASIAGRRVTPSRLNRDYQPRRVGEPFTLGMNGLFVFCLENVGDADSIDLSVKPQIGLPEVFSRRLTGRLTILSLTVGGVP